MKKRVLSLLLAGVMTASLTACGGKLEQEAKDAIEAVLDAATEEETEAEQDEEEPVSESEEEMEIEEPDSFSGGIPQLCTWEKSWYETADDGTLLLKGSLAVPILTTDSADLFPELASALVADAEDQRDTFSDSMDQYLDSAKTDYADMPERFGDGNMYYSSETSVLMQRVDEAVTSYYSSFYDFTGGAHGMYGQTGYTYDNRTGEKLLLTDVFSDTSGLAGILKEELTAAYPDTAFDDLDNALSSYDVALTEAAPDADNEDGYHYPYNWALTPKGVDFYFGPYSLASYADGAQEVTLSYDTYADIMNPGYLPDSSKSSMVSFRNFLGGYDLSGDGTPERIDISFGYSDDYSAIESIYLTVGDKDSDSFDYYAETGDADVTGYYIETPDGKQVVYLLANEMNDYQTLYVFDVTGGTPVKVGDQGYKRSVFDYDDDGYCEILLTDPDRMPLCSGFDFLASFTAFRYYYVGADGMPESDDTYYYVLSDASQGNLVAKTDLECQIVSSDDSAVLSGDTAVIKKGESFSIYRTDGETALDVWTPDGTLGRLTITDPGYPCEINGMVDTDCVEETMYAG